MSDLISRELAIELLKNTIAMTKKEERRRNYCVELIRAMPSAEPEDSIPISWIEKEIDWLNNTDNCFANLTATNISAMVKRWKEEKDG